MKTIKDYMTENKSKVIEIINDEIIFVKTTLKEVSVILVNADDYFQEAQKRVVADKWASVEEKAFIVVLKAIVENIVLSRIDSSDTFWAMIESQIKKQKINF